MQKILEYGSELQNQYLLTSARTTALQQLPRVTI